MNKKVVKKDDVFEFVQTQKSELDMVMRWESGEKNVINWSRIKHEACLSNPEFLHFIIRLKDKCGTQIGYAILRTGFPDGLSVEFLRLVIGDDFKNNGYGTAVLKSVWKLVFNGLGYQRLWHDVFAENEKAVKLYDRLGYKKFKIEIEPTSGRNLIFYEMLKKSN